MPGLGVVPKPRISAGFKTVRSGGLSMPKPPATPKAGRLSPTGGRIGGVPGKTAPRVPGPAKPPAVPGMASKALLTNARRANGRWGFKATPLAQVLGKAPYKRKPGHVMPVGGDFMKGSTVSEREYLIAKGLPKGLARAPRFGVRGDDAEAANIFGHRRRLMHETGREAGRDIARGQREFADDDISQMRQLKRNSRKEWANYQEKGPGFLMPAAKPKRRRVLP